MQDASTKDAAKDKTSKRDPLFGLSRKLAQRSVSKHRMVRTISVQEANGETRRIARDEYNATKTPRWIKRKRNRTANKRARASRKANR